jgi:thiamine kinase-like enzyme
MTFNRLKNGYADRKNVSCNIHEKYEKYIRNDETRKRIASLTKSKIEDETIEIFDHKQLNPVFVYDHLLPTKEVTVSLIHGDFHPDNVVMNSEHCPRIIDFRWSQEHDIYLDFAMFEMSVRYWQDRNICFYMDPITKNEIEKKLLTQKVNYDYLLSLTEDEKVKRMLIIVREIRRHCENIVGKKLYNFKDHVFAQFVVLYGLQKFAWEYNPYRVIPALGSLGNKLKDLRLLV